MNYNIHEALFTAKIEIVGKDEEKMKHQLQLMYPSLEFVDVQFNLRDAIEDGRRTRLRRVGDGFDAGWPLVWVREGGIL